MKAIYQILESRDFSSEDFSLEELADKRKKTIEEARREVSLLARHGFATIDAGKDACLLTPAGWQRACEIVRNHRLWELYLTNSARIGADHVHDDAEEIEHILGEKTVRKLERLLDHAREDPHGRAIPGIEDIQRGLPAKVLQSALKETGKLAVKNRSET